METRAFKILEGKAKTGFGIAAILLVLLMALAFLAPHAYADEVEESSADVFTLDEIDVETVSSSMGMAIALGNDYVWAGNETSVSGIEVANDLLAAGRSLRADKVTIGGSIRAAGEEIRITDAQVEENITIAGETVVVQGGTANDVAMAGRTARFSGSCQALHIYAEKVIIDGTVDGDVTVGAATLEIGPNAVIAGTLRADLSNDPTIAHTAEVGELDVTVEANDAIQGEEAMQVMGGIAAGLASFFFVLHLIASILGSLVIAVLAEWLFRRHTEGAAQMICARTGAMIGTGIVGALCAPIAIVLLCVFIVTLPVAGALLFALIALSLVAVGFMGASIFKLVFPNLGRFKVALIGGAIMGVASAIPILGIFVFVVAFMYLLGYVLQSIFLSIRGQKAEPMEPQPVTPMPQSDDYWRGVSAPVDQFSAQPPVDAASAYQQPVTWDMPNGPQQR